MLAEVRQQNYVLQAEDQGASGIIERPRHQTKYGYREHIFSETKALTQDLGSRAQRAHG